MGKKTREAWEDTNKTYRIFPSSVLQSQSIEITSL